MTKDRTIIDALTPPDGDHTGWRPDWKKALAALPWRDEMATCIQDTVFHAEGDCITHTRMVGEALSADVRVSDRPLVSRRSLFYAALLHDIAKPETREAEYVDGREKVSHRNHSIRGAKKAHAWLYRNGVEADVRERVFGLIAWHQRIFKVMTRDDPRVEPIRFSQVAPFADLALLGDADNLGRINPNIASVGMEIELARMVADELGCLDAPYAFERDEARVLFGRSMDRTPFFTPQPAEGSKVIVLCGLPGSGKDTYAHKKLHGIPVVSLDDIRKRLKIPTGSKWSGTVIQTAYEEAKEHLRKKSPMVWNTTGLTRDIRNRIIDLACAYDAHVSIHVMDTPYETVVKQNRDRKDCLPQDVIEHMIDGWEPPTPLEAHEVLRVSPKHELTVACQYPSTPDTAMPPKAQA